MIGTAAYAAASAGCARSIPARLLTTSSAAPCSDGMPCECNDSTPPDTSQVIIIIEEVTLH